jgi:hypothetical protein
MSYNNLTSLDLEKFEKEIADIFETGVIKAPVHLRNGNEQNLIDIFSDLQISKEDYVYSTWAGYFRWQINNPPLSRV